MKLIQKTGVIAVVAIGQAYCVALLRGGDREAEITWIGDALGIRRLDASGGEHLVSIDCDLWGPIGRVLTVIDDGLGYLPRRLGLSRSIRVSEMQRQCVAAGLDMSGDISDIMVRYPQPDRSGPTA